MNIKNIIANIDKVEASKKIVRFATTVSVGRAVQNVIVDNVPLPENPISRFGVKIVVWVGGSVAAGYVLDHLGNYTDASIDELFAALQIPVDEDRELSEIVLEGTVL